MTEDVTESNAIAVVVGQVIIARRKLHRLSQKDLAGQIGVAQSTLSRIERGEVQPDYSMLRGLASAFEVGPDGFVREIEQAIERSKQAARSTSAGPRDEGEWWSGVVAMAGLPGLIAVIAFAVAALSKSERR